METTVFFSNRSQAVRLPGCGCIAGKRKTR